jgi:4-alpha-glucanotransferase
MSIRTSGILLHPTSLPSAHGIGDLGPTAFRFADFLAAAGQRLWQVLPLNPTEGGSGHSPYHSVSAFAGNPLLISPQVLADNGLLSSAEVAAAPRFPGRQVAFGRVLRYKQRLLQRACERFDKKGDEAAFARFCGEADWLDDFALFMVLRRHYHPRSWTDWPVPLRDRRPEALETAREKFRDAIRAWKLVQYFFFEQWEALRGYCHRHQIRLIGDMPIYVPLDSADVWAHRRSFKLTRTGRPTAVSGVPPDYFSTTGQLWGHPVYDWDALQAEDYAWWVARMRHHMALYDMTRIDHFRGLVAYWEVPARAKTAVNGTWVPAPVEDFFDRLIKRLGPLPVIAEDLGTITADVREVIHRYGFPNMQVLLFAFGEDFPHGTFLPHRHPRNSVVYTGTHDNNTVRGWFEEEADARTRRHLFRYLGRDVAPAALSGELIRLAMLSPADTALFPLQDVLGLGSQARMNRPARRRGNWQWRFAAEVLDDAVADRLRDLTETYGRL